MRYPLAPVRMAAGSRSTQTGAGEDAEERDAGGSAVREAPVASSMELPQEVKRPLPYDPAIPLLGICPEKHKALV